MLLYNGLVRKRNRVDNAWAQIEVQLKRRRDLVPNLVEAVKGYAAHERGTFDAVTQARAAAQGAQSPAAVGAAEGMLSQALGRLFAVAEAYPELKANQNFLDLQAQLKDTEDKIAVSRQVYNDTVLTFNNAIQVFPAVVCSRACSASRSATSSRSRKPGDREAPAVSFQPSARRGLRRPTHRVTRRARSGAPPRRGAAAALALGRRGGRASRTRCPRPTSPCTSLADGALASTSRSSTPSTAPSPADTGSPAASRASRISDVSVLEGGTGYRPGGCTELGCDDAPGTFGVAPSATRGPDRLALPAPRRGADLRDPLHAERARGRLRRRRRRQPERLGRRVEDRARQADRRP